MEGAAQRTEVEYQKLLHLAWHTAYLSRVKSFPSLSAHLKKFAPKKPEKADPNAPVVEPWRVFQDLMRSKAARKDPGAMAPKPRKKRKAKTT